MSTGRSFHLARQCQPGRRYPPITPQVTPVYEVAPHPDFNFKAGDTVLRLAAPGSLPCQLACSKFLDQNVLQCILAAVQALLSSEAGMREAFYILV